nr:RNA-directed DNA polymerase, eukaryota, reverse transcriptase zinc-binding domain protein [Tanacetum cinerariifolium]
MGELWVLLEFPSTKSKELFHEHVGVGSWFSVLRQASVDFTLEGRIVWVEIVGRDVFSLEKIRAKEVPGWVPDFLDDSDDEDQSDDGFKDGDPKVQDVGSCGDDSDVAEVPETLCEESTGQKEKQSEDPSGFTPNDDTNEFCMNEKNVRSVNDDNPQNCNVDEIQTGQEGNSANKGSKLKTGVNLLIVAVYAPHDLRDKLFNVQGADVFNLFIANAGLEEVPLGGSSFTWCHKSATKMSKLDRFLISENLLITCPNISATTLDRYLSDHRPIFLRETQSDYRPVPFRFFHHWTELEGFNKFVIDTWSEAPGDDLNAMRSMIRKLKYLKVKIQEWNNGNRNNTKRAIEKYKEVLEALDAAIDKGNGSDKIVNKRMEVINSMHHIDKIQVMDMAQKAKIKYSIEGNENSRFFHGVLNKKQSQLNIRGIMVDGVWTEKLNTMDLEHDVSKEELKRAVWDCGTDKSPGPDGPTEEFQFFKGFKQGDLLSPFLFTLIMESLHLTFQRVVDAGMFMGIKLSPSLNLSHMFYADDAVFVGQCMLASKEKGGLDVSSLYALNRGLMLKWVWRFYSQKTSLWARVIKAIYDDDGKGERWVWSLGSSGEFFVASVRKVIDEKWLSNVNTMTRWIKCVPIKVNVLA